MYYLIIKNQFKALHKYGDAPTEVIFLRYPHRHLFKIESKIRVSHDNRDEEFFTIQNKIDSFIAERFDIRITYEYSCETIAKMIFDYLEFINLSPISVEVSEDGENIGGYAREN